MKAKTLISERLILVPLTSAFASEEYVSWMNDTDVNRYLESGGNYTLDMLRSFLKDVDAKEILFWAILEKEQKKHIGNIKIDPVNWRNRIGEYGILIGDKAQWGKGYASEATLTILDFCFSKEVNMRKVCLGVIEDNSAAVSIYRKLGFVEEGRYKSHAFHDGKWCNVIRMAIFNPNVNDV